MIVRTGNSPTRTTVTRGRATASDPLSEVCEHGFPFGRRRSLRERRLADGTQIRYTVTLTDRSVGCTHPSRH